MNVKPRGRPVKKLRKVIPKKININNKKSMKKLAERLELIQSEKKYHLTADSDTTFTVANYNGIIFSVSEVAQGNTDITRVGDQLTIRSLEVSYFFTCSASLLARIVVFQWIPNSTPTVADVLLNNYIGTTKAPITPYSHDGRYQFRILMDRLYHMANGTGCDSAILADKKMVIRFPVRKIQYASGGTTGTNKIWCIIIGNTSAASLNCLYNFKLNFSDS